jgi:hypothetical protein
MTDDLYHHVILDGNLASYILTKLTTFIGKHWSLVFYLSVGR